MIGPYILIFIIGGVIGASLTVLAIGLARSAHQADEEMTNQ